MRIENTSEGQKHVSVGGVDGQTVIVPARREGVNGSVEVTKEFVAAAKKDDVISHYFDAGILVVTDAPKAEPTPAKTVDEQAAANVEAVKERQVKESAKK
jgi:hypothetical protein